MALSLGFIRLRYALTMQLSSANGIRMQRLDPKCETKIVTFRLPERDWAKLIKVAHLDRMDLSLWLRTLVKQALDNRTRKP